MRSIFPRPRSFRITLTSYVNKDFSFISRSSSAFSSFSSWSEEIDFDLINFFFCSLWITMIKIDFWIYKTSVFYWKKITSQTHLFEWWLIGFCYSLFTIFICFNILLLISLRDRIYHHLRDSINDDFDFDRNQILFALLLSKSLFINLLNKDKLNRIKLIIERVLATSTLSRRREDCCAIDTKGFNEKNTCHDVRCV